MRPITSDGHRDGGVLSHQVATGKELRGLGSAAPLDFPNAVAENTVRVQPELAHGVDVNDVFLKKIKQTPSQRWPKSAHDSCFHRVIYGHPPLLSQMMTELKLGCGMRTRRGGSMGTMPSYHRPLKIQIYLVRDWGKNSDPSQHCECLVWRNEAQKS